MRYHLPNKIFCSLRTGEKWQGGGLYIGGPDKYYVVVRENIVMASWFNNYIWICLDLKTLKAKIDEVGK